MPTQPIIFLHIPKTGGMSLEDVVVRQFPPTAVYRINGPLGTSAAELRRLPDERRATIGCVYGHVPFGLHACLPQAAAYLTLLRDPVERIVSIYYYARRRAEWGLHSQILDRRLSLQDFVVSDLAAEFHNQQTQMVAGMDRPADDPEALVRAKKNLTGCVALAGITERFDESLLLCRSLFGWKHVFYHRANVNRRRPHLEDISRATIASIEQRNTLDLELYEIVRRRFDTLVRAHPSVGRDLQRFRRCNGLYGPAASLVAMPMNLLRGGQAALRRMRMRPAADHR